MKKESIARLRSIINDIKSGKKEHTQELFHCGTAHCIAGWIEVEEMKKLGITDPDYDNTPWSYDAWGLACRVLDIDEEDADIFFNDGLSIEDIESNLIQVEQEKVSVKPFNGSTFELASIFLSLKPNIQGDFICL